MFAQYIGEPAQASLGSGGGLTYPLSKHTLSTPEGGLLKLARKKIGKEMPALRPTTRPDKHGRAFLVA